MTAAVATTQPATDRPARGVLLVGALGVVFGDIGTSPIYAFRESLRAAGGAGAEETVLGVLSLLFWAVLLVVAVKYVALVMRADNGGEGGTMALLSLVLQRLAGRRREAMLVVGLTGASLFLGDAMITPAISVLSAVEGLEAITPRVHPFVVPITAAVLVGLFAVQHRGSGRVGRMFGPIMILWFGTLAVAGLIRVIARPGVLAAIDPRHALHYLLHAPGGGAFVVVGSVFLALTGAEALYADMGHFGSRSIRIDWFAIVMPALVLNYLGQGALVLADPSAASQPFFRLFDDRLLWVAVLLSTAATVIASQAVIAGAFTLVQQAIQLGVLPRLSIRQTSAEEAGQIYVAQVNWLLAAVVLLLVFGFRSSDRLANAYGIAVAGDMLVTSVLVAIRRAEALAMVVVGGRAGDGDVPRARRVVRRRERAQDPRRRLVPADGGGRHADGDAVLAPRARASRSRSARTARSRSTRSSRASTARMRRIACRAPRST